MDRWMDRRHKSVRDSMDVRKVKRRIKETIKNEKKMKKMKKKKKKKF